MDEETTYTPVQRIKTFRGELIYWTFKITSIFQILSILIVLMRLIADAKNAEEAVLFVITIVIFAPLSTGIALWAWEEADICRFRKR